MNNVIHDFLEKRQKDQMERELKKINSLKEKEIKTKEIQEKFNKKNWILDASKRCSKLNQHNVTAIRMVTHVEKLSHPDAHISPVFFEGEKKEDGFLRTGNNALTVQSDVVGNAAYSDISDFLSRKLDDKTIFEHFESNTEKIQNELSLDSKLYEEVRKNFLSIKKNDYPPFTDTKIKQIYFPVGHEYHILSILTGSATLFELKKRINDLKYSPEIKELREAKNKNVYHERGYDELYDLTIIGFGGTKPQNISVLNSKNGGKSYLLLSVPPLISQDYQKLPTSNFFKNLFFFKNLKKNFLDFHQLLETEKNNKDIRDKIKNHILSFKDNVIDLMWETRNHSSGWSEKDHYKDLPKHQKIWLDDFFIEEREKDDIWLQEVIEETSRSFLFLYKNILKDQGKSLNDDELLFIKKILMESKEDFQ